MWDHRARIESVHDGDTVKVYQDDGREEYASLDIRLFGTFAPELNQVGGTETRDYAAAWVKARDLGPWPFVVQMMRNKSNTREVCAPPPGWCRPGRSSRRCRSRRSRRRCSAGLR